MGVYLRDNPPARDQFRSPRREEPSGVCVVHTAESTPDFVAFDGGAEAVARFIQGRTDPGSYHDLVDSDSAIQLVSYDDEAYQDGTGSNRHAWGGSVATRADVWPLAPKEWRDGAIRQLAGRAANYARWLKSRRGIVIPARRITRSESELRVPGFISHAERDPARRTDPGREFPWAQFFDEYRAALGDTTSQEDDMPLTDDDVERIRRVVRQEIAAGKVVDSDSYLAKPRGSGSTGDVFSVANDHTRKVLLPRGPGNLHEWVVNLRRLSGLPDRAVEVDQDVLDQIPTVEVELEAR